MLSVLDGAVLVVSAVEGVQPQTRVLMRALQRLRVPTLLFVNKIDRAGADDERVLRAIAERLTPAIVPMGSTRDLGTRDAGFTPSGAGDAAFPAALVEVLAEHDDVLLAAYVEDEAGVSVGRLREELAAQTGRGARAPGLLRLGDHRRRRRAADGRHRRAAARDRGRPGRARLGHVSSRSSAAPAGEKIAYVRMFSGTVRTRDRVRFGADGEGKVTAIAVFERGPAVQRAAVSAGRDREALGSRRDPDRRRIGETRRERDAAPVRAADARDGRRPELAGRHGHGSASRSAQLAEQDPLIDVRQDERRQEISVSLYGEVQKEVIQATLASDFGLDVTFRETTTICVERPAAIGEAVEILHAESNPFAATIGLRVEPAPIDSGVEFRLARPSISARCRCTSQGRSRTSRSSWASSCVARSRKASTAGGSPTAP